MKEFIKALVLFFRGKKTNSVVLTTIAAVWTFYTTGDVTAIDAVLTTLFAGGYSTLHSAIIRVLENFRDAGKLPPRDSGSDN